MSKVAIVYWSGTGNTQSMAEAVKAGAVSSGASAGFPFLESPAAPSLQRFKFYSMFLSATSSGILLILAKSTSDTNAYPISR